MTNALYGQKGITRRGFLGAGSAFALGGCRILTSRSPNGKLVHASVGTANMAWRDIVAFRDHPDIEMAVFCDVDADFLAKAKAEFPQARCYRDWREMLAAEGDRIDSVCVSTPDHMHAAITAAALRAGKHVYCQKPLARHHDEMKLLRELAVSTGRVTQLGTQIAATDPDRMTVAYLRSGALGPVRHVWTFSTRSGKSRRVRKMPVASAVPRQLDWDKWLGVAAERPYSDGDYHPLMWRMWTDFGAGFVGDICPHIFSSMWLGMDLGSAAPQTVSAVVDANTPGGELGRLTWPRYSHITWTFGGVPATDGRPFEIDWVDGPSEEKETPAASLPDSKIYDIVLKARNGKDLRQGKVIECELGFIVSPHVDGPTVVVMKNGRAAPKAPELAPAPTHYHEFVDACLGRRSTRCDFGAGSYMCEAVAAGGVAELLPNRRHTWNAQTRTFDTPEATALTRTTYRKGWEVKGI